MPRSRPRPIPTVFERRIRTRRSARDVFAFFDRPSNLKRVTPESLSVSLLGAPEDLRPGQRFRYRLEQWPLDLEWDVVVSDYRPPRGFTNVKAEGYFPAFSMDYAIDETESGAELTVTLSYEVPSGIYARLSDSYVIRDAMERFLDEQTRAVGDALDRGE